MSRARDVQLPFKVPGPSLPSVRSWFISGRDHFLGVTYLLTRANVGGTCHCKTSQEKMKNPTLFSVHKNISVKPITRRWEIIESEGIHWHWLDVCPVSNASDLWASFTFPMKTSWSHGEFVLEKRRSCWGGEACGHCCHLLTISSSREDNSIWNHSSLLV